MYLEKYGQEKKIKVPSNKNKKRELISVNIKCLPISFRKQGL